jgi:DegV family protein with EDD domain
MTYRIVVDSCCAVTPEQREDLGIVTVPLTLMLGERSLTDDDALDLPQFMEDMKNCTGKVGSAAPAPALYRDAFLGDQTAFAVTLSSNLSGSYGSALLGKELAEGEGAEVHVFDSKSASAGEVLITLKIGKMIREGAHKARIISYIESFIREMKTYFVLDSIDNLLKNGRIGKITGKLISVLNIKPIMGSDGDGNIALYSHARGQRQIIEKLTDLIEKSGRNIDGESMVIAHCNNLSLAEKLKNAINQKYRFKEVHIVPTRGLSSLYANDKGIIMAF